MVYAAASVGSRSTEECGGVPIVEVERGKNMDKNVEVNLTKVVTNLVDTARFVVLLWDDAPDYFRILAGAVDEKLNDIEYCAELVDLVSAEIKYEEGNNGDNDRST